VWSFYIREEEEEKGEQGGSNNSSFHAIVYFKEDRQCGFGYD
jgi:hypothetical protein